MAIIKILREQSAIGFDGKIIVQDQNLSQHLGQILICSGTIVGCNFLNKTGKKALINLLVQEFDPNKQMSYVVEPEVIALELIQFELEVPVLEEEIRSILEESKKNKKLRPPGDKRLVVNADFVCRGEDISSNEFDILCLISDFGKIQDVYDNTALLDFEVTDGLVSLRKKGALKVIA